MATIVLQNGVLVVRFNDGSSRSSGVSVNAGMSQDAVQTAIGQARSNVATYYAGAGNDAKSREAERASGSAAGIYRQLHPEEREQTEPPPQERRAPPPREQRQPPQQRRETETPVREERRGTAARPPPRPRISGEWLETQLREARRDDRRALAAATAIYANRNFVNQFLSPDAQRGTARTDAQKNITIAAFNSLYQIPAFRLYLSSLAAMRRDAYPDEITRLRLPPGSTMPLYPDYVTLQTFLTEPGRPESLSEQASAEIIRAADAYVRHFLIIFAAPNQLNARYNQEISQMNIGGNVADLGWRMRNAQGAMTFQPASGRGPTDADRAALAQLYISGPMDSDTLGAAVLFIRRWSLEHPDRGRGRSQDQISLWQAPQIIPREQEQQATPVAVQPQTPVVTTPQQVVPRIAIVGDSIMVMSSSRVGATLQTTLQAQSQGASVTTHAHGGDQLTAIRTQLRQRVLGAQPPYNTVIIQGGVNSIASGVSVEDCERTYTQMINEARQAGLRVIIVPVTPTSGASNALYSRADRQVSYTALNAWLRGQASGNDVVVVDISSVSEGNPPRWKQQFDSGDHIHPSAAGSDQLAALVAQAAYGIAPTVDQRSRALTDFANQYWANLAGDLYRNVSGGNAEGVISILRNKPQGTGSVEEALRTLRRDDIQRAFDRVFNDFMRSDQDFLAFCREYSRDNNHIYANIAREGVRLSASTDEAGRRQALRAMQDYLNYQAQRSGQDWYRSLREDLRLLYRQVLSANRDDIVADGQEDMRTLAALSVYAWRKAHQSDAVGGWGPNLNLRIEQPQQVQPPPPPPPPQRREEGQRGRTIIP